LSGCRPIKAPRQAPALGSTSVGSPASPTLTLAAVGDILLDRGVAGKIDRFGIDYPFKHVADILSAADIAFGNLECPLSESETKAIKPCPFRAKPSTAQCLVRAGFDILSLANNHTMDCGRAGLVETMERLGFKGIRTCGAGSTRAQAEAATVMEAKGIKVAFLGFCDFVPEGAFLLDDKPSIAFASEEAVRKCVAAARSKADVVVASFHWGVEYASRPSERQAKLATAAAEAGADLVLGHHPHVLQGFQVVGSHSSPAVPRPLIAYSLGNFVFDQDGARQSEAAILRCAVSRSGITRAEVLPVRIDAFQPRAAGDIEAKAILARLADLSRELGAKMTGGQIILR
jgi:poly-gamma-glutamate synthesis protein (capsule biosynthesis protein)